MTAMLWRVTEDKEEADDDEKNGPGDIVDISQAIGKFSLFSIHILLLTIFFYYVGITL